MEHGNLQRKDAPGRVIDLWWDCRKVKRGEIRRKKPGHQGAEESQLEALLADLGWGGAGGAGGSE